LKDVRGLKNEAGFSLVELMVVVAIIGILASLAIPSVGKYMAKARQSEAKTQLSSLYTAEKAFYAEYTAYHSMFGAIGYSPEGKLRYMVGMAAGANDATATNGYTTVPTGLGTSRDTLAYCGATGVVAAAAGCTLLAGADNSAAGTDGLPAGTGTLAGSTFLAGASARVYQNQPDMWTINNNKVLANTTPGIN
jgi:type IV pilus assembly protein PilA